MRSHFARAAICILAAAAALGAGGCATTPSEVGAVTGAVIGGVAGHALIGGTAGTVLGAGTGAFVGHRIGSDSGRGY